ncbi:hypothetical protein D3C78_952370 [compost metagenome]
MLPGDHQQVHGAGVLQYAPVIATQSGSIAQHQRRQRSRAPLGVHRQQALANGITPGPLRRPEQLPVLDRSRGTDALRQQPGLVIKGMGIEQTCRTLQLHRQAPALATVDRRAAVPGQSHQAGQRRTSRLAIGQFETHYARGFLRQADHPPLDPAGLTVKVGCQAVSQCPMGAGACPGKTQQKKCQCIGAKRQQHQGQHR